MAFDVFTAVKDTELVSLYAILYPEDGDNRFLRNAALVPPKLHDTRGYIQKFPE